MTSGRLHCGRKPEHLYLNEESGGRDSKRRGGNGSRENDGSEPVSVRGLNRGIEKSLNAVTSGSQEKSERRQQEAEGCLFQA